MKYAIFDNVKNIIFILIVFLTFYALFLLSYAPNPMRAITLPIISQDSPYLSPEGWPLPYPPEPQQ